MRSPALVLALAACLPAVHAACLTDDEVAAATKTYAERRTIAEPPVQSADDARCSRAKYTAALEKALGKPIGYKVGLTNAALQRALKGTEPAWGVLFPGTLLPDSSEVSVRFAGFGTVEADLLVRVRSAAIHEARTPQEVLQHLDQVIPYIELPDLMLAQPLRLDANIKTAFNLSARAGVAGTPVPVPADATARATLYEALGTMRVQVFDGERMLGESPGSDLLGHPMQAALWLVQALHKEGVRLQAGHVLSLGSFPPVRPPRAGQVVRVRYEGLPGAQPVSVRFTP
jgi:2-keto-4-pentenoate hydratase